MRRYQQKNDTSPLIEVSREIFNDRAIVKESTEKIEWRTEILFLPSRVQCEAIQTPLCDSEILEGVCIDAFAYQSYLQDCLLYNEDESLVRSDNH